MSVCFRTQRGVRAWFRFLAAAFLFCFHAVWQPLAAETAAVPPNRLEVNDELFTGPKVRTFKIVLAESEFNRLRRSSRTYVHATVSEGGRVFENVGVHLKGMGSFRPLNEKPSFTVKFDEFTPDQEYCGLTKIMLNNSVQDTSYLAELLGTGLFRDAGVPAARVTYARVEFNGRDLGLYLLIEGMNKRFLKRHFQSAKGNLYEGYLQDVQERLDQDGGAGTDQADVRALFVAGNVVDPSERFKRLSQILDVDRFVSFAAMEILVSHWDGYTLHTNNYRIYHDPTSDRMVFMTHGLDGIFRRPNISIQPPLKSIVGRALLQTAEGKRLYQERVGFLFTNVFRIEVITNRLEQALERIRSAGLPTNELVTIERNVVIMRDRIVRRSERVAEQLKGIEPQPLPFTDAGIAKLAGWRTEPDIGNALIDEPKVEGRSTLHIDAQDENCRASWRLWIYLKPGHYTFEGMVRTARIRSGGAGLRISGDTRNMRIGGDTAWRELRHNFEVEQGGGDVELVCELRTLQGGGEVWFDLESLKLKRRGALP